MRSKTEENTKLEAIQAAKDFSSKFQNILFEKIRLREIIVPFDRECVLDVDVKEDYEQDGDVYDDNIHIDSIMAQIRNISIRHSRFSTYHDNPRIH